MTAPLFEDECNAMDSIVALVAGQLPFPGSSTNSDGSGGGSSKCLRDCPSPRNGPLDGLCESWEGDQASDGSEIPNTLTSSGTTAAVTAGATVASTEGALQPNEGLNNENGSQGERTTRVAFLRDADISTSAGLSASAPLISGTSKAHTTVVSVEAEGAIALSIKGGDPASADPVLRPGSVTASPPPVPKKPASVTNAFLAKESGAGAESSALWDGSSSGSMSGGIVEVADGSVPGTLSPQDLLLEWLRREASEGDEEAQFHLAQLFSPPRFDMKEDCRDCGEPFGVTRYRYAPY